MKFEQHCTVPASREALWQVLMDIERVGRCFPGADEVVPVGDGVYSGRLKVKMGPVSLGIQGTLRVGTVDRDHWQATMMLEGADRRVGGGVRGEVTMRLEELSPQETELHLTSDISFMGRLGELGQPIIRKRADTTLAEFAQNLSREASA